MNSYLQLLFNGLERAKQVPGKCTVVALTSAVPGEGVSYVTRSFAFELARRTGRRTLIASAADLQKVKMIHFNQVQTFCSRTDLENLYVLSNVEAIDAETEAETSLLPARRSVSELEQALENLQTLRFVFDYVFLDCEALSKSDISAVFGPSVEGVALVVEAERTRKEQVRNALSMLAAARANVLGCVLNKRRYHIPSWIYSRL